MKSVLSILTLLLLLTSCSHTYYVVRHAEKATPSSGTTMSTPNDPPLSAVGEQQAQALKDTLAGKKIAYIFSTNTVRTKSTAEPLRNLLSLSTQIYSPMPDSAFIAKLKGLRRNTLIVGHSNTVDNIVNGLTNANTLPADLQESEYDNLFVVTYRRFLGTKIKYKRLHYGALAN